MSQLHLRMKESMEEGALDVRDLALAGSAHVAPWIRPIHSLGFRVFTPKTRGIRLDSFLAPTIQSGKGMGKVGIMVDVVNQWKENDGGWRRDGRRQELREER